MPTVQVQDGVRIKERDLAKAIGLVRGELDPGLFFDAEALDNISRVFGGLPKAWHKAQREKLDYGNSVDAPWPSQPNLEQPALVR